jgi:hypothetical protein
MTSAHLELHRAAGLSAARATMPGIAAAAVAWAGCWATGILPAESVMSAGLGVALAAVAALAAAVLHRRMAARQDEPGALVAGAGVTRALALGFVIKLLAFAAGSACVLLSGMKFPQVAAFAIAFAAAALVCQAVAALGLARQLQSRSVPREQSTDGQSDRR